MRENILHIFRALAPGAYFARLVETSLKVIWADPHADYIAYLKAKKSFNS
jgi:hypothetical protein